MYGSSGFKRLNRSSALEKHLKFWFWTLNGHPEWPLIGSKYWKTNGVVLWYMKAGTRFWLR